MHAWGEPEILRTRDMGQLGLLDRARAQEPGPGVPEMRPKTARNATPRDPKTPANTTYALPRDFHIDTAPHFLLSWGELANASTHTAGRQ